MLDVDGQKERSKVSYTTGVFGEDIVLPLYGMMVMSFLGKQLVWLAVVSCLPMSLLHKSRILL